MRLYFFSPGIPGLQIQFMNVSEIFENHRDQIDDMVGLFTTAGTTILMPGPFTICLRNKLNNQQSNQIRNTSNDKPKK